MDDGTRRALFGALQLAFVAAAAAAVYGFVTVAKEAERRRACTAECLTSPDYAGADRTAPDFALKDMNGREVKLSDYRGKVVLLNFWSKTCGFCLEEMPSLVELTEVLAPKTDVAVLTISIDDGPADIADTVKTVFHGPPPFPVLFDPDGEQVVRAKFGTHLFPETWLIDKRGVIRARFDGKRDWASDVVVELVDQLREGTYCPLGIDKKSPTYREQAVRFCSPFISG
jgi:peroxiredoxin